MPLCYEAELAWMMIGLNLSWKVPQIGRGQSFSYLPSITKEYAQLRVRLDGNFRLTSSIFMWFVTHFCSNTLKDSVILVGGGPDSFSDRNEIPLDKVYNYPLYKTVATYNLQSKYSNLYRCTLCQGTNKTKAIILTSKEASFGVKKPWKQLEILQQLQRSWAF